MVIFHSYVKLPEGILSIFRQSKNEKKKPVFLWGFSLQIIIYMGVISSIELMPKSEGHSEDIHHLNPKKNLCRVP
jgi:hypothetical protein